MKIIGIILIAAITYFAAATTFAYFFDEDVLTRRDLVRTAISGVVFAAIFVPIMMRMTKNKVGK